jgi:hypothetical protein
MPLYAARLRDSDFAALTSGDEFKAGVLLWCAAWTQVPAGSLPADDRILARLAGVNLGQWAAIKDAAIRGFVLCSDGRIYHPVISEAALDAWRARLSHRQRGKLGGRPKAQLSPSEPDRGKLAKPQLFETEAVASDLEGCGEADVSKTKPRERERDIIGGGVSARERDPPADASPPPDRASPAEWGDRLRTLHAELGDALNLTSPGVHSAAVFNRLIAAGLSWSEDIRPAVCAIARSAQAGGDRLRAFSHPGIDRLARASLIARTTTPENRHVAANTPATGGPGNGRRLGPAASIVLASQRGEFDYLDALPIAASARREGG